MKFDQKDVKDAAKKLEELCLKCEKHVDTCYVSVAKRSINVLKKD